MSCLWTTHGNAGGINISHRLAFLLTVAWMFLPSFAVITGTIHAWYGARNCLTPNQDTSNVNVMNTKSGNRIQNTGREAAVKQYIYWPERVKPTLASSLNIGGKLQGLLRYSATTCSGNIRCGHLLCSYWEELKGEGWKKDLAYSPSPHQYTHYGSCRCGSKSKNGILAVPEHQGEFSTTPVIPILQILSTAKRLWACDRQQISRVSLNPLSVNLQGFIQVGAMTYVAEFKSFSPICNEASYLFFRFFHWRNVQKEGYCWSVT